MATSAAQAQDVFNQLDTNHDGVIDRAEFAGLAAAAPAAPAATMPVQYTAGAQPVTYSAGPVTYTLPANYGQPYAAGTQPATYAAAPQVVPYGTPQVVTRSYAAPQVGTGQPVYSYVAPHGGAVYPTGTYASAAPPVQSYLTAPTQSYLVAPGASTTAPVAGGITYAPAASAGAPVFAYTAPAQVEAGAPVVSAGAVETPAVIQSVQAGTPMNFPSVHSVQAPGALVSAGAPQVVVSAGAVGTPLSVAAPQPFVTGPLEQPGSFIHLHGLQQPANTQQAASFVATSAQMEAAVDAIQGNVTSSAAAAAHSLPAGAKTSDKKKTSEKKGKTAGKGGKKKAKKACLCF